MSDENSGERPKTTVKTTVEAQKLALRCELPEEEGVGRKRGITSGMGLVVQQLKGRDSGLEGLEVRRIAVFSWCSGGACRALERQMPGYAGPTYARSYPTKHGFLGHGRQRETP